MMVLFFLSLFSSQKASKRRRADDASGGNYSRVAQGKLEMRKFRICKFEVFIFIKERDVLERAA